MSWEMPSEIHKCVPAWPTVHRRLPDSSLFGNDQKHGLNNSIVTVAVNNAVRYLASEPNTNLVVFNRHLVALLNRFYQVLH